MLATIRFDSSVSTATRSSTRLVRSTNRSSDGERALAPGQRRQLVERREEPAQLGAGDAARRRRAASGGGGACDGRAVGAADLRRASAGARGRPPTPSSLPLSVVTTGSVAVGSPSTRSTSSSPDSDDLADDLDDVAPVVAGHRGRSGGSRSRRAATGRPTSSGRARRPGCGSAIARRLCSRSRISGGLEQRQPADDGVRDALVAEPRDDRLAVLVLAVQDRDVRPGPAFLGLDRVDDRRRLVLRVRAGDQLDLGSPGPRIAISRLSGSYRVRLAEISRFATARTGSTERKFSSIRMRVGRRGAGRWVVERRPLEPAVELGERREARAAEAVDRLVVVADDHEVVRPVRRPAEQLDELDLGDVRVLELVDEDVAVLALVAAEDVRPALEELGDGGDLLAEVERRRGARAPPGRRGRRARARRAA